jgi:hypothetical protein
VAKQALRTEKNLARSRFMKQYRSRRKNHDDSSRQVYERKKAIKFEPPHNIEMMVQYTKEKNPPSSLSGQVSIVCAPVSSD